MISRFLHQRPSIRFVLNEAQRTLLRFPLVLVSAILTTAYSIYAIEEHIEFDDAKLALTFALGIPLFLASTLLRESNGWTAARHRLIELVFGVGFLAAHYFLTVDDGTSNYFLKYLHLSLVLHLLVAFVAFIRNRSENEFWQFNRHVFLRILLSALYSGVFYCGVAVALVTIEKLFSLNFKSTRYAELWLISALVIQTWHFLAGVPYLQELKNETAYPKGLRFFVQFLLIPLVSLYTVILYCYMAKILITRVWPSGYIGWLVSIMSVLGIFNLLLIDPEKNRPESRWISTYSKLYYILILPLLAMLFIAIGKRVNEYGVTEPRAFLIMLGALLTGLAAYFIFSRSKNIKIIPISLFVLGVLALWGPWSPYSFSMRNQKARAEKILAKNALLAGGTTKPATIEVSKDEQKQLSSIFDYLIQHHGPASVQNWFPKETLAELRWDEYDSKPSEPRSQSSKVLMTHLGLTYIDRWNYEPNRTFSFQSDINDTSFDLAGYDAALLFEYYDQNSSDPQPVAVKFKGRSFKMKFDPPSAKFVLMEDAKEVSTLPMAEIITRLEAERVPYIPSAKMSVEGTGANPSMRLVIRELRGQYETSSPKVERVQGVLLLK